MLLSCKTNNGAEIRLSSIPTGSCFSQKHIAETEPEAAVSTSFLSPENTDTKEKAALEPVHSQYFP
jgi:hypothetical protein